MVGTYRTFKRIHISMLSIFIINILLFKNKIKIYLYLTALL